jgi:hypothetical protein
MLSYRDNDGQPRMALRGEKVDLEGDELTRAEELGAVVTGELDQPPVPAATAPRPPTDPGASGVDLEAEERQPAEEQSDNPTDEQPEQPGDEQSEEKPAAKPARRTSAKS